MSTSENYNISTDVIKHLMDTAGMKSDLENLKQHNMDSNTRLFSVLSELSSDMKGMRETILKVPQMINDCRVDIRGEVERDFPNKLETVRMENRIEDKIAETDKTLGKQIAAVDEKLTTQITSLKTTVDKQWLKISVIVTTIVALGGVIQWFFVLYKAVVFTH